MQYRWIIGGAVNADVRSAIQIGARTVQTVLIQDVTIVRNGLRMPPRSERPVIRNTGPQWKGFGCAANVTVRSMEHGAMIHAPTVTISRVAIVLFFRVVAQD